jgi:hypothetical protein
VLTHRAWMHDVPSPGCGLSVAVGWVRRSLSYNGFTGPLPTELGTLTALTELCVHRPHPPRPVACAVTGLRTERGGGEGAGGYPTTGSRGHCPQSWAP